jgi:hypothetical protein
MIVTGWSCSRLPSKLWARSFNRPNILYTSNFHRDHCEAERAGRRLNLTHIPQGDGIAGHSQNR